MPKTIEPYQFLAILRGGKLVAAQIEHLEITTDDGGIVIAERALGAKPVTADSEFSLSIVSADINTAAVAKVAELESLLATKDTTISEKEAALTAEAAHLAQIKAMIADPALDDKATVAAILERNAEKDRPERDKKIAALQAEIDALNGGKKKAAKK